MKKTIFALIAVLILALGAMIYNGIVETRTAKGKPCTLEAKMCPDGSYVGRVGPNCEFSSCPNASTTPSATSTGTGGGAGGILPYKSGVEGVVMLGPTCPVMRNPPEPQCADKPYSTLVAVFRASDTVHAFALGRSDANGRFSFSLSPGDYVLGAGESNLPRCNHPEATVGPDSYATVNIDCDTGIR